MMGIILRKLAFCCLQNYRAETNCENYGPGTITAKSTHAHSLCDVRYAIERRLMNVMLHDATHRHTRSS